MPTSIYNVTNNYIDYDYNVINQNPTIFNVYNGGGNSGTIVNSFDVHEAAIVISDDQVVGYYLKVTRNFVEAKPVAIALTTTE